MLFRSCTAIGKVLLAWENDAQRRRILAGCDFKRYRDKTITTLDGYIAELDRTKLQGYGQDREEFDDHIRCLGVPIFDRLGQPIAGLSVSFPTFRYDDAKAADVVAMLQAASRDISTRLGCTDFPLDAGQKKAPASGGGGHGGKAAPQGRPKFEDLTVNIAGTQGTRYLKVSFNVEGKNSAANDKIDKRYAELVDASITILSSLTMPELDNPGSKAAVRGRLIAAFNDLLKGPVVEQVFFSDFVVQ